MAKKISFEKRGSGPVALILIHGFPMNHHVWDRFTADLENAFTIYMPDLPGFGNSEAFAEDFSIDDVALAMNFWVFENSLQQAFIVGHSLGGYVVLAMQKQKPEWFRAFGLLHSTAVEDSIEKKESRTKVLKFIDDNGVIAFTSNFIEPLFANASNPAIAFVKSISVESTKDVVKGYTKAMRDRPDNRQVIEASKKPVLIIGGEEDKGITVESLKAQAALSPRVALYLLPGVAHMGMFENQKEIIRIFQGFVRSLVG